MPVTTRAVTPSPATLTGLAEAMARADVPTPLWFAPYEPLLQRLIAPAPQGEGALPDALNRALHTLPAPAPSLAAGALRFVPQAALPAGEAYERFIDRTAQVPTRENLHDALNGLVWLRFPQLKRRLNEAHAAAIARDGVQPTRGAVRDVLTLFDESAAWLQADPRLVDALRRREWRTAFVTHRAAWAEAQVVCFGHALLEKLVRPWPGITAHVWVVPPGVDAPQWLAERFDADRPLQRPDLPLPVLGIPGWWPANEDAAFYDDVSVFRPLRRPA
jgi:hypothetical protein